MSFKLEYDVMEIDLRSPDSGDQQRITLNDIRRYSRSGTARVAKDNDFWITTISYVYKFSSVPNVADPTPSKSFVIHKLLIFMQLSAGKEITITDHFNIERDGYILTPITEVISARPNCSYSFSFEFLEKPI